jgi:hypothetical protein
VPGGEWRRIGVIGGRGQMGSGRFAGRFTVNVSKSGYHQNITFYVSQNFGSEPTINVINQSRYPSVTGYNSAITGIRLVRLAEPVPNTDASESIQATYGARAVEILLNNINTTTYYGDVVVSDCGIDGFVTAPFTPVAAGTTTNGPAAGFDKVELQVNPAGMGSRGEVAFEARRTSITSQTANGKFLCDSLGAITGVSAGLIGAIYNEGTGIFTAPASGMYRFYVWALVNHATAASSHAWRWYVNDAAYLDSTRIAHSPNATNSINYSTVTNNINLRLKYGDTVYPYISFSGGAATHPSGLYNSWGGSLIS